MEGLEVIKKHFQSKFQTFFSSQTKFSAKCLIFFLKKLDFSKHSIIFLESECIFKYHYLLKHYDVKWIWSLYEIEFSVRTHQIFGGRRT